MTDEAEKEQEMRAQEAAEREAKDREDAEKALAENVESVKNEGVGPQENGHIETAIELQAARYAYIENLERRIMADGFVEQGELEDAMNCKAQVLLELVAVEDYASKLSKDDPSLLAVGVLKDHLYKCYNKTEKMRDRLAQERQRKIMEKHYEEFNFQTSRRRVDDYIYREKIFERNSKFGGVIHDNDMLPKNNMINLAGLGLSAGSLGMLSQLIKNPSETIKAQMPDLLTEFAAKITGQDKETITGFIGDLTTGLNALKSAKAMTDALEGLGSMAKMLSAIKSGNAI